MDVARRTLGRCAACWTAGLALLLLALSASAQTPEAASAAPESAPMQEAVLEFTLNAQTTPETLVAVRDAQGAIWLQATAFAQLRLRVPSQPPRAFDGGQYYPLNAVPGIAINVDEVHQRVTLQVPADAFESSHVMAASHVGPPLTSASPGAFLNYQLTGQRIEDAATEGAAAEIGVFGPPGVLTNTGVTRVTDGIAQTVRLDTTFTHDFVSRLETLELGDAISTPGNWGDAVRFGGVHWGTNFGIRPDLITAPMLAAAGAAVVPSTVDIFVNDQRVSSQQLPPGPFVVGNLPALSGAGDVRVVVRDALGQEQVLTQSFYSGATLLAAGLSQYGVDFGAIRNNYALTSDDYGHLMGEETYRRGITDALTLEEHAEFLEGDAHAAGIDAAIRTGSLGILTLTAAGGGDSSGSGALGGIGFEHRAARFSFVASTLIASDGFRQVGDTVFTVEPFKQRTLAQVGFNLGHAGSLSVAYALQTYPSLPQQQTVSLSHNVILDHIGSLSLTVSRLMGPNGSTSAFLMFTHQLGARSAVSADAIGGSGPGAPRNELMATVTENPPIGPGYGYRLGAATDGDYDADWREQFSVADFEAEAARNQLIAGQRASLQGAATWLDGELHLLRSVPGSFAMVDVAGLADVPVYLDNQLVAHTDEAGRALLPQLRPFEPNRIGIDPIDLPLDTSIGARSMVVAPAYRAGVIVRFPVERVRGGTFRLVTEDGHAVPPGALVRLKEKLFPVALDGMTYVTGYDHGMAATAQWSTGACKFRLKPPPSDEPLPDLGTVTCYAQESSR